jgi:hypothetical protein
MENKIFLNAWMETKDYLFLSTVGAATAKNIDTAFDVYGYMIDKNGGEFYRTKVTMDDFDGKEILLDPSVVCRTFDSKTGVILLPATELMKAAEDGKLSGRLKEIVADMDNDDEFVIMLLNFR